jgi:RNA polymerase sigma-70 factor (ECF subfamily)
MSVASDEAVIRRAGAAVAQDDRAALGAALTGDVVALVDSGGDLLAPILPVEGREAVVRELLATLSPRTGSTVAEQRVNGALALVARRGGRVEAIVSFGLRRRRIERVWIVRSPQKLRRWNAIP